MDANFINSVLLAFSNVLPQIGFQQIQKGTVSLAESMVVNSGVMVSIGIVGAVKGTVLVGMDVDGAKRFASAMMMGMPVTELDAMAQSTISEMGNMVCANACTSFSQAGMAGLDISPPAVLLGSGGVVKLPVPQTILVKFSVDDIPVDVYVGMNE
ncbi:putative membrane protein [Propionispora sp. 2/2-37]|uniref:chemotaxis protein CheX n=1 Tax=Propionispora sp. 2/2-37 TaxID=1677858 RepID=UPI0006BB958B|nr:chemotaxis protein CheX [Propionispora sp. 2/2-37]CUH94840.1 putative membrane protein [Propionispora sp. 2/2-37]